MWPGSKNKWAGGGAEVNDVVGWGSLNVDYIYETEDLVFLEPFYPAGEKAPGVGADRAGLKYGPCKETVPENARLISRTGGGKRRQYGFFFGAVWAFRAAWWARSDRTRTGILSCRRWPRSRGWRPGRDQRTGRALIVLGPDRDRIILLLPNANRELTWDDVDPEFVRAFRVLHLTSILGEGLALQERLAREVAGRVLISCDPGEVYAQRGTAELAGLIACCDLLFITQGEVELLTGRNWNDGIETLRNLGTRIIVVKKKGSGAFIREAARTWELPAPVVQARDTTGAGDVFAAGFLGGFLRGLPLPACGSLGLAMAHRSMTGVGREAYPTQADFEAAVKGLV